MLDRSLICTVVFRKLAVPLHIVGFIVISFVQSPSSWYFALPSSTHVSRMNSPASTNRTGVLFTPPKSLPIFSLEPFSPVWRLGSDGIQGCGCYETSVLVPVPQYFMNLPQLADPPYPSIPLQPYMYTLQVGVPSCYRRMPTSG